MPNSLSLRFAISAFLGLVLAPPTFAADASALNAALGSITAGELRNHVAALADDTFEGREAGSRGGRAAGLYLVKQFEKFGLKGGVAGSFYQQFAPYTNILAILPGTDPELKNQYIVVGAHYDHVGYGSRRNSYGPIGFIHNGADDNASGVAGLLEVAEAFAKFDVQPKRSILFCLWDGEEKGLYGSKHWLEHPTVPLDHIALAFNADMIGRLRGQKLEVLGVRTAPGMRRLVSLANDDPTLSLVFNWEMKENSDHHPFFAKKLPIVMFHTGLHSDYHRPSDDIEKINAEGIEQTSRLLYRMLEHAASVPKLGAFRAQSRFESPGTQQLMDRPLPPLPGRLGLRWDEKQAAVGKLVITSLNSGSPAEKAGLRIGDQIIEVVGQAMKAADDLRSVVATAKNPVEFVVERRGAKEPLRVAVELTGKPVRLGISWRIDDAEPNTLIVNRVFPGSPAARAGIAVNDRILRADEEQAFTTEGFLTEVASASDSLGLLVESNGRPRIVSISLPHKE